MLRLTCRGALQLDSAEVLRAYRGARRRLLVLGYNATLTTAVEAPRQPKRHFDQIKARPDPPRPRMLVPGRLARLPRFQLRRLAQTTSAP